MAFHDDFLSMLSMQFFLIEIVWQGNNNVLYIQMNKWPEPASWDGSVLSKGIYLLYCL